MPIVLARIDDRLIHGQVTVGWGMRMKPDVIAVVSDRVASTQWECDLYLSTLPDDITGIVLSVNDAPSIINDLIADSRLSYVLFESPKDAYQVVQSGAHLDSINVGGMHSVKGKREILHYLFVDDMDSYYLKELHARGVLLDFRDLPEHENIDVMSCL
jgi:mannose PTS system EIIAB component